jgi:hypothetical protein
MEQENVKEVKESQCVQFLKKGYQSSISEEEFEILILETSKKFKLSSKEIVCLLCECFLNNEFVEFMKIRTKTLHKVILPISLLVHSS